MIHTKLYQRVAAAYQDDSEMPKFDVSLYDDPQETVDNALMMLEYAKKRLENEEWEVLYYCGAAVHTRIMRYPGTTYAVAGEFLGLKRFQTTVGVRIYKLFRDHLYSLPKLSGIQTRDVYQMPNKIFARTLQALIRDFPEEQAEPIELEFELDL